MGKTILMLVPYPRGVAASQRFRFEQYYALLEREGYKTSTQAFWPEDVWPILYREGNTLLKLWGLCRGLLRRLIILPSLPSFDYVFIHREVTPLGPPIFELLIANFFRKKIIFDFDDSVWLSDENEKSAFLLFLKFPSKIKKICRVSYKISCGNKYLADYSKKYNLNSFVNPTTIDTEHYHSPDLHLEKEQNNFTTIGWTGSHSTLKYLKEVDSILKILCDSHKDKVRFLVIADHPPEFLSVPFEFIRWSKSTEITDLLKIDIGIMPLTDDDWTRGKCGFKALQYMSLEIPAVASPVGVNKEIIVDGVNGFLCDSQSSWTDRLSQLIDDVRLRREMGKAARKQIISHYSTVSNSANFLGLFL